MAQELLQRLQIERVSNVVKIDLDHELVTLQRTEPLDPPQLAWVVRVLGKGTFVELFFGFGVVLLLLLLLLQQHLLVLLQSKVIHVFHFHSLVIQ